MASLRGHSVTFSEERVSDAIRKAGVYFGYEKLKDLQVQVSNIVYP